MKRSALAGAAFGAILLLMPLMTFAATSKPTFLGPIVPPECRCDNQKNASDGTTISTAPDYGCVMQTFQNSINFGITIAGILFTIYIVIAGFALLTAQNSSEALSKAKTRLLNVAIGLVVMLVAWLLVDYVMKTLYDSSNTHFGPWNTILAQKADGTDRCIVARNSQALETGTVAFNLAVNNGGSGASTGGATPDSGNAYTGSGFTYQSEVQKQIPYESGALGSLLSCMSSKVPAGVGQISAITERAIADGTKTMQQCATSGGCAHTANSCHYGGRNCVGKSYAVDFGDEKNAAPLRAAAKACNANAKWNYEGTHVHISVGEANGCNCDAGLQSI